MKLQKQPLTRVVFGVSSYTGYKFAELDKEKMLKIFANNNYGFSDYDELLAERFAYWLLTKQNMQTKIWAFWN